MITILIVEDNPGDVFLIRRALKEAKIAANLVVVDDGQSALSFLEKEHADGASNQPSLMLLDLNLPKIGGASVLDALRNDTRYARLPIIIMTSSDSPMDHAMAAELRADHYFRKPSDLDGFMQLGGIVRQMLHLTQTQA